MRHCANRLSVISPDYNIIRPVQADHITGFLTVSSGEMAAETMPKTLRRDLPSYPLAILRIAPLAVYERLQGHVIGQLLLRAMLELALEMRNRVNIPQTLCHKPL